MAKETLSTRSLDAGVRTRIDTWLSVVEPRIRARQEAAITSSGRPIQGLISHHGQVRPGATPVADVVPDNLSATPTDRSGSLQDLIDVPDRSVPWPVRIQVNETGDGWEILAFAEDDQGSLEVRTIQYSGRRRVDLGWSAHPG